MSTSVHFHPDTEPLFEARTLLVLGRRDRLLSDAVRRLVATCVTEEVWEDVVGRTDPTEDGRATTTWTGGTPKRLVAGVLPEPCSRHNTPTRSWGVPKLVEAAGKSGDLSILVALDADDHLLAMSAAIARALPAFAATSRQTERLVRIAFLDTKGDPVGDVQRAQLAAEGVRAAARLVDLPPNRLDAATFTKHVREVVASLGDTVGLTTLIGDEVRDAGLGGLWGVGKGAETPPALLVLDHDPGSATRRMCWVGKGIVFDTGGLSIKSKTGMVGMKTDMGGAAAVLHAFATAVRLGCRDRLTAILCVAENAVSRHALRPDDILQMYSGRTVEVNNTDAEGRLVLADGVAWAVAHRAPDELVDMATLTGAQSVATGKRHAGVYCNQDALEDRAVEAGRFSGDLVHPLPYCPEFFRREFRSQFADLRNSVKDRANAQSSCAGEFIRAHLGKYTGPWLHVDMAGPATRGGKATGWGVAFLLALAGVSV